MPSNRYDQLSSLNIDGGMSQLYKILVKMLRFCGTISQKY